MKISDFFIYNIKHRCLSCGKAYKRLDGRLVTITIGSLIKRRSRFFICEGCSDDKFVEKLISYINAKNDAAVQSKDSGL